MLIIGVNSHRVFKKLRIRTSFYFQVQKFFKISTIKNSKIFPDFDIILAFIMIFHVEKDVFA